jgi:hypothetical protein
MTDEWKLKEPKKVEAEPVRHPSMDEEFPPLPAQVSNPVVEHDKVEETSVPVEETPVQKIDVVKPSRDSVLEDIHLTSLLSFAKGNMENDELFAIFRNLPPV